MMNRSNQTCNFLKSNAAIFIFSVGSIGVVGNATAEDRQWYVQPVFGLSQMSSTTGTGTGIGTTDGNVTADLSSGFNAGLAVGRKINDNWSVDLLWEYRSNDSEVTISDGSRFTEGNYASNYFFLNTTYRFQTGKPWTPYVGAGVGVAQEIDIDLESGGVERSLSGSGGAAYQFFGGVAYSLSRELELLGTLRYAAASSIDLESEDSDGSTIDSFDYNPFTVQMGLNYAF